MKKIDILLDLNVGSSDFSFEEKNQLLIVKRNLYDLEKFGSEYLYFLENSEESFLILNNLIRKKKIEIKYVIINTPFPYTAKLFLQCNFFHVTNILFENLLIYINFMKFSVLLNINFSVIIFLHEFNKKTFFFENQIYNNVSLVLMGIFHNEYKKTKSIRTVCVATDNIFLSYKKNIYPYVHNYKVNNFIVTNKILEELLVVTNKVIFF